MKKKAVDMELLPGKTRFERLTCSRCQFFDVLKVFEDGRQYLTFDPDTNLSFFDDDVHFTMTGLDMLRPVYIDIIARV